MIYFQMKPPVPGSSRLCLSSLRNMSTSSEKPTSVFDCFNCHSALKSATGVKPVVGQVFKLDGPIKELGPGIPSVSRQLDKYLYWPKQDFIELELLDLSCKQCDEFIGLHIIKAPKGGPGTELLKRNLYIRGKLVPALPEAPGNVKKEPSANRTPTTEQDRRDKIEDAKK